MTESPYSPPKASVEIPADQDRYLAERPREIVIAIWLVVIAQLVNWAGLMITWDYQMAVQALGIFIFSQVVGIAFAVWLYYKIYQGRNWARILLLILTAIGLASLLIPDVTQELLAQPIVMTTLMVIQYILHGAILWLLFVSPGRLWFRKKSHG